MKTFEFERLVNECIWEDQLSRIDVLIEKGYQSPGYEYFENKTRIPASRDAGISVI